MGDNEKLTPEQLAKFNGSSGEKTYVAVGGKVYDVSDSDLWEDGEHMGAHDAGRDLTAEMEDAPHGAEVLENFPVVGEID